MEAQIEATLAAIQEYLNQRGYDTHIQPPLDINPNEQLLVSLSPEFTSQDVILRLFWAQTMEDAQLTAEQKKDEPQFLQFFILLPFVAIEQSFPDLSRFLFNLNATLDMAHFGLYENGMVYYRHVHVCIDQKVAGKAIEAIILSIQFLFDMLFPAIKDVALGQKTLSQIQEEARKALEKSESSGHRET